MHVLITGGAGFIGSNTAYYYLSKQHTVTILDNFSRRGSVDNIEWLKKSFNKKLTVINADIRYDQDTLIELVKNADFILHLAGQVAVTTSVLNPQEDFDINAKGTLNVLEAMRISQTNPVLLYSSTNKVYGDLKNINITEKERRYEFENLSHGVSEEQNLDFYSPYGCSKGAADQYVRDYARIYGLNTIVFRQSCIYGPRQFGIEDQGWIAWFLIALAQKKDITIYGNGKQVRDILYIDDLIQAFDLAYKNKSVTTGQVYNIGGGAKRSISVWNELQSLLEKIMKTKIAPHFAKERPGDQHIYISDIRKAKKDFGWEPNVSIDEGITKLYQWVLENKNLFESK